MRRLTVQTLVVVAAITSLASQLWAAEPAAGAMGLAQQWTKAGFDSGVSSLPFSFTYMGKPSAAFLGGWNTKRRSVTLDHYREQQTLTYTDPATHLELRCVIVRYKDYPTVEWTLYFKNTGSSPTPIVQDIQALDTRIPRDGNQEFLLHYSKGSSATPADFQPLKSTLSPTSDQRYAPVGGRPSDGAFPYFNLAESKGGVILAIGWPGQWAADFTRDQGVQLRIRAGQELTHFKLLPGEEVRSPLIVLQFYQGDWIDAQNQWRHWMIAHNLPRPGGTLPTPLLAGGSCPYYGPFIHNNEENQELFIRRYLEEGIKIDYWWIDAGWYPNDGVWTNTGTWEVDTSRFPRGLRAVSDYAHARGIKLIVWFEPERVTPRTWLYEHHPEWLLKVPPTPAFPPSQKGQRLLDMGNPAARQWVTEHVDKMITEQGIDVYRQDFNIQALPFWRANDAEDRQGITEIRYVEGYLSYWDELRHRHPKMLIDNCASGGRRLDLESLRRSVPLWRSDDIIKPLDMQNQTYGVSLWFPYNGLASQIAETGNEKKTIDTYAFRSDMFPSIHAHWDVRRTDIDYARLRQLVGQWKKVAPDYTGDYYPLTSFDASDQAWMAWQFARPETGSGVVQAFRRPGSLNDSVHLKLRGLDPQASYKVTDVDAPGNKVVSGRELMDTGLPVVLRDRPGSLILLYEKVTQASSHASIRWPTKSGSAQ
jgi:alpha-galactosidase